MVYIRIKGVKNSAGNTYYYAYLVENKWISALKSPRQKVLKYLGRIRSINPLTKEVLLKLLESNPICAKCESEYRLTVDHIIPLSKGGNNELSNLQVLCAECNASKGNKVSGETTSPEESHTSYITSSIQ